jgi:hypothetical protein
VSTIREDLAAMFKEIQKPKPLRPSVTVHHPKCGALASGDLRQCSCGGWAFPT